MLTAAHCIRTTRPANSYSVLIHGHDKSGWGWTAPTTPAHPCTEAINAAQLVCHPSYVSATSGADICLLQLQRPATCGSELAARGSLAHLDSVANSPFVAAGTLATVAGWGATSMSDGFGAVSGVPRWPDTPREVTLPLITNHQCKSQYGGSAILNDMICAGRVGVGLVDSCQGDSGGPLFVVREGRAYQIGVVSWGRGCALPGYAGVYARVAYYYSWILSHVPSVAALPTTPIAPPGAPSPPAPYPPPPSNPPPPSPPAPPPARPGVCNEHG